MIPTPSWEPFLLAAPGAHAAAPRAITSPEGIGDRLRAAAFAEIQAREAFEWGARYFTDAPEGLRIAWRGLARAEDRHLHWLLARMQELGVEVGDRLVSDQLWHSLITCTEAHVFAHFMANAEERGRKAGVRFADAMAKVDPLSAAIFGKIAEEEVEHILLAEKYFPKAGAVSEN